MTWNNGMHPEPVQVPADGTQPREEWHADNNPWQPPAPEPLKDDFASNEEKMEVPVDAATPVETSPEENLILKAQATTVPKPLETGPLPWLKGEENDELRARWNAIQIEFVNEPRTSVEQADALVAETLERIEKAFMSQRTTLNEQWTNHADIATEDLRIALQSYRAFFNRLLAL
jgi:hypothetical protein